MTDPSRREQCAVVIGALAPSMVASGGATVVAESRSFITSDGARLHVLEAGPSSVREAGVFFLPLIDAQAEPSPRESR